MINHIHDVVQDDDRVSVIALVEDAVQTHSATMIDPPEYGSAMCKSSFYLEENEILPENETELIEYLENLDLDWIVLPNDWND